MAQEDDLDLDIEGTEPAPKSKSGLIILIVGVVLLLGVSATATLILTGVLSGDEAPPEQAPAGAKTDEHAAEKGARKPLNYVPLDPPFVVNFSGNSSTRFLQITVEAGTRDPEAVDLIKDQLPAIRDALVMLFSGQDPKVLNTREGKEKLRSDTLSAIQKVMRSETGKPRVEGVFFTSFVMQ